MLGAKLYDFRVERPGQLVKGEFESDGHDVYEDVVASVMPGVGVDLDITTAGIEGKIEYMVHTEITSPIKPIDISEGESSTQIKINDEWFTLYKIQTWEEGPQPHIKSVAVRPER